MSLIDKVMFVLKAGNTGKKGGQLHNDNAAKDHIDFADKPWQETVKTYDQWRDSAKLTPEQDAALTAYSLNSKNKKAESDLLSTALSPLPQSIVVYRGDKRFNKLDVGHEISYKGLTSTSLEPVIASGFGKTIARIKLSANTPVLYGRRDLTNASNYQHEREIIIKPHKFRVTRVLPKPFVDGNINAHRIIELEQIT